MDTVLTANTGLWVSFAVSVLVLIPVFLEFGKRNLPVLFGIIIFLFAMKGMSSQSPEMHSIWLQMQQIPNALFTLFNQVWRGILP